MRPSRLLLGWLGALLGPLACPAMAESALDMPCSVEYRGRRFSEAFPELAGRLGVPYILDSSVDEPALEARVRLSASQLSGAQALRWLARMAGLEGVLVEGTLLVAKPERLPASWRAAVPGLMAGLSGAPPEGVVSGSARWSTAERAAWEQARARRMDVSWVDTPLSGAARDISRGLGIDLIVHPTIAAEQKLLQLERPQADLETVCAALGEQLGASLAYVDGALWAWPKEGSGQGGGLVWRPMTQPALAGRAILRDAGLAGVVTLDRSLGTWAALGERLAEASGLRCRLVAAPDAGPPGLEATGSVGDILEGARLLGRLSWSLAAETDGQATLSVNVAQSSTQLR